MMLPTGHSNLQAGGSLAGGADAGLSGGFFGGPAANFGGHVGACGCRQRRAFGELVRGEWRDCVWL